MRILFILAFIGFLFWYKPFDECRKYSDFNCHQIQKADYNVWFYFNNNENGYYLGQANSLDQCRDYANEYAYRKELSMDDWTYICCMRVKDSECYEKHR